MAGCMLFVLLLVSFARASSGVVSVPFNGNTNAYLKVHWILQWEEGGVRNVSVRHSSFRDPQVMWRVNDVIVSESSPEFTISNIKYEHENIHSSWKVSVTSLLIPSSSVVNRLELHLVLNVVEVVLLINLPHLGDSQSRLEYPPTYKLQIYHSEHIQYDVDAPLKLLTSFYSEILNESTWLVTTAQFIGIDTCLVPLNSKVIKAKPNRGFIHLSTPTESELPWRVQNKARDPNFGLRYIHFPVTSGNFWGLLKVTSGFLARDTCIFFGGIKVTKTAFLRPPTHGDFFTANTTVLLKPKRIFYVPKGGDIDVSISAVGGNQKEWRRNLQKEYPNIKLFKNRQQVSVDERIDVLRLFQREVIFRFRNITEDQAGRYQAKAQMERGRARHDFTIYVNRVC